MKMVLGLLFILTALSSQAQDTNCNMIKLEKQVRDYLWAQSAHEVRMIEEKGCLDQAIDRLLSLKKIKRNLISERHAVLDIAAEIKQDQMAAQVKCETSGTPGCLGEESKNDIEVERRAFPAKTILEKEADLKAANPLEGKDW